MVKKTFSLFFVEIELVFSLKQKSELENFFTCFCRDWTFIFTETKVWVGKLFHFFLHQEQFFLIITENKKKKSFKLSYFSSKKFFQKNKKKRKILLFLCLLVEYAPKFFLKLLSSISLSEKNLVCVVTF